MSKVAPRPSRPDRESSRTDRWPRVQRAKQIGIQALSVVLSVAIGYGVLLIPALASEIASGDRGALAVVTVTPRQSSLNPADIDALTRALPDATVSRNLEPEPVSIAGVAAPVDVESVDAAFFSVFGLQLLSGTFFTPADDLRADPVAVIGEPAAQRVFGSATVAIGKSLRVGNVSLTVIGVLAQPTDPNLASFSQSVFVPLQTGRIRLLGNRDPAELAIRATDGTDASTLAVSASGVLAQRYPSAPSAFAVQTLVEAWTPESIPRLLMQGTADARTEFLQAKGLASETSARVS